MPLSLYMCIKVKGTVHVISSNPPFKGTVDAISTENPNLSIFTKYDFDSILWFTDVFFTLYKLFLIEEIETEKSPKKTFFLVPTYLEFF